MSYLNTLSTHKIVTDRFYLAGHEMFPELIEQLENVQSSLTDGLEDKVDQSVFDANILSLTNELQTKQTKGATVSIVGAGGGGSTAILDLATYTNSIPSNRIITTDMADFSGRFDFQSKQPGNISNPLVTPFIDFFFGYRVCYEHNR